MEIKRFNRRSLRLTNYDYASNGMYFVTISVKYACLCLGRVIDGKMIMNRHGQIVADQWQLLPEYYPHCRIDEFIVMPDHFHGIIEINQEDGCGQPPLQDLSSIIRAFKLFSAKRINALNPRPPFQWHRSYYDHIIRNKKSLTKIRQYIQNNPLSWDLENK